MKILMVCLGNICRSPLAEGILRSKLEYIFPQLYIDSAGTIGMHAGEAPDHRSIKVASIHGIDISKQKSRMFLIDDFNKFDFIFAMDQSNKRDINSLTTNKLDHEKVHLFLEFANYKQGSEVPDPYYGGPKEFEEVYQLIDKAAEVIAKKMIKML